MSTTPARMRINRLTYRGPERNPVIVEFGDGLNIVWGASNHGKSFMLQTIDFMLGKRDPLDMLGEGSGLDQCMLWLTFSDGPKLTLQRAVAGGAIETAVGHLDEIVSGANEYQKLNAKHDERKANFSTFLLDRFGFRRAKLLKNERANKSSFSLRLLFRYAYINEDQIFSKASVAISEGRQPTAEDKSLLKFLVTGVDGSAVAEVPTGGELKAAKNAKLEVLQELLSETQSRIDGSWTDEELEKEMDAAEAERDGAEALVREHQEAIDAARASLASSSNQVRETEANAADLRAMVVRFNELRSTLVSDTARLAGLEEGGFLLRKFSVMNCPLCGADPEYHHHDHELGMLEAQQSAAEVEIKKITAELSELDAAIARANMEISEYENEIAKLRPTVETKRATFRELQGDDRGVRARFVEATETLRSLQREFDSRVQADRLEGRIEKLNETKVPGRPKAEDADPSLSTTEAHEIAKVVKRVLVAWGYPGVDTVIFDLKAHDLIIDGKERKQNGKGVRAILHSAFKVAILIYCHEQGRPHPGFLLLDTPLRAYREPEESDTPEDREGDAELVKAGIADRFYAHLNELREIGQFIVVENNDPPNDLASTIKQIHYDGGQGLL